MTDQWHATRLVRAETDARRWDLRERFLETLTGLAPQVANDLHSVGMEGEAGDWLSAVVRPQPPHSIWTQRIDAPPWLAGWCQRWHLQGSERQWVEKVAIRSLASWRRESASQGQLRFASFRPEPQPDSTNGYGWQPFSYTFPALDQAQPHLAAAIRQALTEARKLWLEHLRRERALAISAGYAEDVTRSQDLETITVSLRRLVQYRVLERTASEIARLEGPGGHTLREGRNIDARFRRLQRTNEHRQSCNKIWKDIKDMAERIGLPVQRGSPPARQGGHRALLR